MLIYNTGLSGLRASQAGLEVVSNNIANANTDGYHRQQVQFRDRQPLDIRNQQLGRGVDVSRINQVRDGIVEQALTRNTAASAFTSTQLETLRSIEALLTPGTGSLHDRLTAFFSSIEHLSSKPNEPVLRSAVLNSASDLARGLNNTLDGLSRIQSELTQQIRDAVNAINSLSRQLTAINEEIRVVEARGLEPNDLRDRRDQLVNELAGYVDVVTWEWAGQPDVLSYASGEVIVGRSAPQISVMSGAGGSVEISIAGSNEPLTIGEGELGGLLAAHNQIVGEFQGRLEEFTAALIQNVDGIQATGLGINSAHNRAQSTRPVSDVTIPLAGAGSAFPIAAGELSIAVRDEVTGVRTLHRISVDPSADSLQDVAARISAISHLQAVIDSSTGTLTIASEAGYRFDFTRDLTAVPDVGGITGTASPRIAGTFNQSSNDTYTFTALSSGVIGTTADLQLEVRDQAGGLVAVLDVGAGYEAGTPLNVGNGISVILMSGDLNLGDNFQSRMIGNPDEPGILSALGILPFFSGSQSADVAVHPDLLSNPEQFASSLTGLVGDGANVTRLLSLRDGLLVGDPPGSFEAHLAESSALIGLEINSAQAAAANLEQLGTQLHNQRESVSGVDPNEEFVQLLQFQRSFQAAARVISAWDESLDDLFLILR